MFRQCIKIVETNAVPDRHRSMNAIVVACSCECGVWGHAGQMLALSGSQIRANYHYADSNSLQFAQVAHKLQLWCTYNSNAKSLLGCHNDAEPTCCRQMVASFVPNAVQQALIFYSSHQSRPNANHIEIKQIMNEANWDVRTSQSFMHSWKRNRRTPYTSAR